MPAREVVRVPPSGPMISWSYGMGGGMGAAVDGTGSRRAGLRVLSCRAGSPNPVRTAGRVLVRHEVVDVDAPRRADLVVLAMAETGDAKGKPVTQPHVEVLNSVRLLLPDRHEDPGPHDRLGRLAADAVQQDPQDQDVLPVQVDAMERRAIHAPLELEDHGVRRQAPQLVAVGDDDGVYLDGYGLSFGWVSEPLVDQLLAQEA
jgi:hypothetical protein